MTLTKALWASLCGTLSIIVLMASAWAHEVTVRTQTVDVRLSTIESHYAAIETALQDLKEQVRDLTKATREERQQRNALGR